MRTVIGLDYGTQAARALLIDAANGQVLCSHTVRYPHGVMEGNLASADDYENALEELLRAVTPEEYRHTVMGICVDATSMTMVPLAADGRILCRLPGLENETHAQIKLWKRHNAQPQAEEALALAREMHCPFLGRTGGTISSEWILPKLLETRDEAPDIYSQMDAAMDLCEFLTYRLTGTLLRSAGAMSFKCLWARDLGMPPADYLDALRPGFAKEYAHLLRGEVYSPGDCVGTLHPDWCEKLGLPLDVKIATGVLDGHTSMIALGALEEGDATLVVGTSNVLSIQTGQLHEVEGICGIALDGVSKGLYGIDAGQGCTGDMLEWFMNHAAAASVVKEAAEKDISVHQLLMERVQNPWENTVMAVDWWNGSRNTPCDLSLSGVLAGMKMDTRPEDIYLALLQSIVCGTREIMEQCESYGIQVSRVLATGGITGKNPLLMQEYANILNRTILVGQFAEGPALGSAIFAAVAAGIYETPLEASRHMGVQKFTRYEPDQTHRADYEKLFRRNHALRKMTMELNQLL